MCIVGQDMEQQGTLGGYGAGVHGASERGRGISGRRLSTGRNAWTRNSLVKVSRRACAMSFLGPRNSILGGQGRNGKLNSCLTCAHTLFPLALFTAAFRHGDMLSLQQQCTFQRSSRNHRASQACKAGTQEMRLRSLGLEYPLEKEMASHSSILACRIPWIEEPRGL